MSCASTKVETASKYKGQLPRPDRILVYDFAVSPEDVKLDKGLSPEIARLAKGTPRTEVELKVGREVADALSKELVKEIQAIGLPAERVGAEPVSFMGNILRIEGQLISIDEGNRTERMVIGLGLGRTKVDAHVQIYETTPERQQRVVEDLSIVAKSGRKPGMAEMMGVGAVAGNLVTAAVVSAGVGAASEAFGANVEADAKRTAKAIVKRLKPFFAGQGWIPPDA